MQRQQTIYIVAPFQYLRWVEGVIPGFGHNLKYPKPNHLFFGTFMPFPRFNK
jgi:hypothetical protein